MMLIEEGRLALTDPVSKYIPSFARVQVGVDTKTAGGADVLTLESPNRPVTIEDLLRHTSGITYDYIGSELTMKSYRDADIFQGHFDNKEFAERIARLPLSRQPGTLWRYGHSTDVLGRVIETVSGKSLYGFLRQRILSPLGMTSTKFVLEGSAEWARMAEPLPHDSILRLAEQERRSRQEWESAGGGLVSSITDYARFSQMLLNGGKLDGKRYLRPETYRLMTTDHIGPGSGVDRDYFYFPGDGFGFGYGLAVRTDPGNAKPPPVGSIGELKWDSGSGTYFGVDPKLDMFYIMLEQTQTERGRILPIFKKLVYDAFEK
jgi:CubicO group peptidase (beta-lactamase class C family)